MRVVVAGLLAAGAAWLANTWLETRYGERALVFGTPLLEELCKTGAALLMGAPVLAVHFLFGTVEALVDLLPAGRRGSLRAGAVSLLGHLFFGAVTMGVAGLAGSWWIGMAAAAVLHMGWNSLVAGLAGTGRRS